VHFIACHDDRHDKPSLVQTSKQVAGRLLRSAARKLPKKKHDPGEAYAPPADYSHVVAGLKGPVLVMEYLENSSLSDLLERLKATETLLPNRVLLAFSLCCESCVFISSHGHGGRSYRGRE
jgi:hypothetical protein